jgi:hypothetical protein
MMKQADVAQLAERVLGKDEVTSSILVIGSILRSRMQAKDAHHSSHGNANERRWADVLTGDVSYGWQAREVLRQSAEREGGPTN